MKKIFMVSVLVIFSSLIYAQDKYFIYFNDKGFPDTGMLSKASDEYQRAYEALSRETIARRIKNNPNQIISSKDIPISENYVRALKDRGIKILHSLKWMNAVSAYLLVEEITELEKLNFVKKIVPVKSFKVKPVQYAKQDATLGKTSTENLFDYGFSLPQYELSDVPAVHDKGINGEGVIIGIIDGGFRIDDIPSVRDLDIIGKYDFVQKDSVLENQEGDAPGQDGHGTSVLSICGGFDEGEIVGPSFGASFLIAKTEEVSQERRVEEDDFAAAVEWMESQGVDIITTSLGYNLFDDDAESYTYADMDGQTAITTIAMEAAFDNGVVTVTSAGNEGDDPWTYITAPADGENILAVGAVNSINNLASFSSLGPTHDGRLKPEILAMGKRVYMAGTAGGYKYSDGTSYAAPIVAGIAGQLMSAFPHLTNSQVRDIIIRSGDNYDNPNYERGHGLISAERVLAYPNLELNDNVYSIKKIFFDYENSGTAQPQIFYRSDEGEFFETALTLNEQGKSVFNFAGISDGDKFQFCFNHINTEGELIKDPVKGVYEFTAGSMEINVNPNVANPSLPDEFILLPNYPNPFKDWTNFEFNLKEDAFVKIKIFNILGELIDVPVASFLAADFYSIKYDFKHLPNITSGVYFYLLEVNGSSVAKKMMYIK